MRKVIATIDPYDSTQSLKSLNQVKSNTIYIIVILLIISSLIATPFIKIRHSIQGRGFIRSSAEKKEIKTTRSEVVTHININEGQPINKGDTLLVLRHNIILDKIQYLKNAIAERQQYIEDLNVLLFVKSNFQIQSGLYIRKQNAYKLKISEIDSMIKKVRKEEQRNKALVENKILFTEYFNKAQHLITLLEKERSNLDSIQLAQWEEELVRYIGEKADYQRRIDQLYLEKQYYHITSPMTGTVEEFSGIYIGSVLFPGQTIAAIRPESEEIAEILVPAKDIGYLREGQTTQVQIDAYNYNQWGILEGKIIDISDDFNFGNNAPVFKVICQLNKNFLELKNGTRGNIKKGMTVNARIIISEQSLLQMLSRNTGDWIKPSKEFISGKY